MLQRPTEETPGEDTMLYRAEGPDSDPARLTGIWGHTMETIVVDAAEVDGLVRQGWARHPNEVDVFVANSSVRVPAPTNGPKKAASDQDSLKAAADALEAANGREAALQTELEKARETEQHLLGEIDAIQKERVELTEELAQTRTRAEAAEAEAAEMKELIAAFDGDNDGKPGGSAKKGGK